MKTRAISPWSGWLHDEEHITRARRAQWTSSRVEDDGRAPHRSLQVLVIASGQRTPQWSWTTNDWIDTGKPRPGRRWAA